MNETGLSVSELNLIIAEAVRRDPRTRSVLVRGEISSFRNQIASGHWYFSLKDAQATITCAMFRNANLKAKIRPKDGDQVLAEGYIDFYGPQGKIQLIVTSLRSAGLGEMYIRLEELKRMFWRISEFVKEFMLMMQRCTVLEKARTFFCPAKTSG